MASRSLFPLASSEARRSANTAQQVMTLHYNAQENKDKMNKITMS